MIAVIQRVSKSSVKVEDKVIGEISKGLNILLGVQKDDTTKDVKKLVNKIVNLRIFSDENDKMNLSLLDINAQVLVISQFTLSGNVKKGRRPSFENSAEPKIAEELYEEFISEIANMNIYTQKGVFGAKMDVLIQNDGPVTFVLNSNNLN